MADPVPGAQVPTDAPPTDKPAVAGTTLLTGADAGKPAEIVPAVGADGKPVEAKVPDPGAPEKYEFKLLEGVTLDTVAMGSFEPVLRKLNLSNDAAGELVAAYAQVRQSEVQANEDALAEQVEAWAKQTREDKDLGGTAFEQNVVMSQAAYAAFGSQELGALLDSTGLGNHPEVVRFFHRIGKALGEDALNRPADAGGSGEQKSLAQRMYPGMK